MKRPIQRCQYSKSFIHIQFFFCSFTKHLLVEIVHGLVLDMEVGVASGRGDGA